MQGKESSTIHLTGSSRDGGVRWTPRAQRGVGKDRGPPAATGQMIPPGRNGRAPRKCPVPHTSSHLATKSRAASAMSQGIALASARPMTPNLLTLKHRPPAPQTLPVSKFTGQPRHRSPDTAPAQLAENYPIFQNYSRNFQRKGKKIQRFLLLCFTGTIPDINAPSGAITVSGQQNPHFTKTKHICTVRIRPWCPTAFFSISFN